MKNRLTPTQTKILARATDKLRQRRIVFFNGGPNGKTEILEVVRMRSHVQPFKSKHPEDFNLEILEDIRRFPRSEKVTTTYMQRLILSAYGEFTNAGLVTVENKFGKLMLSLRDKQILPVLVADNIEVIPRRAYSVMKELNEYIYNGIRCGISIALAGDMIHSRMPLAFYQKSYEIDLAKISLTSDIAEILGHWFPEHARKFSQPVLEQFRRCSTTQGIIQAADKYIDWMLSNKESDERTGVEAVSEFVGKVNKLEKLYERAA
jgi:hypothetical protein